MPAKLFPLRGNVACAFVEAMDERDVEGVKRVFVVGSASREGATPASDLDLFSVLIDRVD